MSGKIIELAYIRNKLATGCFNEAEEKILNSVKAEILKLNSPLKDLAINAINNCKKSFDENQLESAAIEIQLIHNITFYDPSAWNSNYFYKIELLAYLEQVDDVDRIKELIYLLAKLQER